MSFLPLDLSSPDSLESVVSHIDYTMQYGEDEEPKEVISFNSRSLMHGIDATTSLLTWIMALFRMTWNEA